MRLRVSCWKSRRGRVLLILFVLSVIALIVLPQSLSVRQYSHMDAILYRKSVLHNIWTHRPTTAPKPTVVTDPVTTTGGSYEPTTNPTSSVIAGPATTAPSPVKNQTSSKKYLFYLCDNKAYCYGIGDRQRSLVGIYLLAELTNRTFGMIMTSPSNLIEFYKPNIVNWNIPSSELENKTSVEIQALGPNVNLKLDIIDFNLAYPQDIVYIRSNQKIHLQLVTNPRYRHRLPSWVNFPTWKFIQKVWLRLCTPTPELRQDLNNMLLNISQAMYDDYHLAQTLNGTECCSDNNDVNGTRIPTNNTECCSGHGANSTKTPPGTDCTNSSCVSNSSHICKNNCTAIGTITCANGACNNASSSAKAEACIDIIEKQTQDKIQFTRLKHYASKFCDPSPPRLKPNVSLEQIQKLKNYDTVDLNLVCVHIRLGHSSTFRFETNVRNKPETMKVVWEFLKPYVNQGHHIYLATDANEARFQAKEKFGDRVHVSEGNIVHVASVQKGQNQRAGLKLRKLDVRRLFLILTAISILFALCFSQLLTSGHYNPVLLSLKKHLFNSSALREGGTESSHSDMDMKTTNPSNATGHRTFGKKYVLYVCDSQVSCYGLGDRQRAIVGIYILATLTNRTFGLIMTSPSNFTDFYQPNVHDWNIPASELEGKTSMEIQALGPKVNLKLDMIDFNVAYPQDVVFIRTNQKFQFQLEKNFRYKNRYPVWAQVPTWKSFQVGWLRLMTPTQQLRGELNTILASIAQAMQDEFKVAQILGKGRCCASNNTHGSCNNSWCFYLMNHKCCWNSSERNISESCQNWTCSNPSSHWNCANCSEISRCKNHTCANEFNKSQEISKKCVDLIRERTKNSVELSQLKPYASGFCDVSPARVQTNVTVSEIYKLKGFDLVDLNLVCVHIRLGHSASMPFDGVRNKADTVNSVWEFLQPYMDSGHHAYLATDTEEIRIQAKRIFGHRLHVSSDKIIHIDNIKTNKGKKDALSFSYSTYKGSEIYLRDMDTSHDKSSTWMNLFSYSNLVHAISGATGSVIAISVFYPLDTVRTRLQVDDHRHAKNTYQVLKEIIQEEGIDGLYLGWFPVVTAVCCSNFVYFYTYSSLKSAVTGGRKKASPLVDLSVAFVSGWTSTAVTIFISNFVYFYTYASFQHVHHSITGLQSDPTKFTMFIDLLIAFVAGVVNVLVTTPLWVANTRLKLQGAKLHTTHYNKKEDLEKEASRKYNGIIDCILKILYKEGVKTLWGGTVPSVILASNPAIQFMIYEALKRYFRRLFNVAELSGLMYFLLGAVAKSAATVITYPLQVVQSRLRAGYAKVESSLTLLDNLFHLVKTRGIGALYKGMEAKLLQTVFTAALMFAIYEKLAALIFKMMGL